MRFGLVCFFTSCNLIFTQISSSSLSSPQSCHSGANIPVLTVIAVFISPPSNSVLSEGQHRIGENVFFFNHERVLDSPVSRTHWPKGQMSLRDHENEHILMIQPQTIAY